MRMTSNATLSEDVANEVFLDVWQNAGRFKGQSQVSTYLLSIARNKAISQLRKRRPGSLDEEMLSQVADDEDTPEISAQKLSKAEVLRSAIDGLPEQFRTVVDLVYYQELSLQEIAAVLDIPVDTVKTRLFRARKKIGTVLESTGIDGGWP